MVSNEDELKNMIESNFDEAEDVLELGTSFGHEVSKEAIDGIVLSAKGLKAKAATIEITKISKHKQLSHKFIRVNSELKQTPS